MTKQRKREISLALLSTRARWLLRSRLVHQSEFLLVAQATDIVPFEILAFLKQASGGQRVEMSREKQLEIAWLLMKFNYRHTLFEIGIKSLPESLKGIAKDANISTNEAREYVVSTLKEIIDDIFFA